MTPIRLSDDELDTVLAAARPLDVHHRDAFLREIAARLRDCGVVGPALSIALSPRCSGAISLSCACLPVHGEFVNPRKNGPARAVLRDADIVLPSMR
jgi:hypothetical protein